MSKHTPCWGEQGSVDGSEAGQSHKDRNQPGHHTKMVLPKTLPNSTNIYEKIQPTNKMQRMALSYSLQVVAVVNVWQKFKAHHGNSLRLDHDFRRDGGEVCQVGQNVHHRHYRHGYDDGQGQVSMGGGQRSLEEMTYYLIISDCFLCIYEISD